MKSSRPLSAHCRSSNASITGSVSAIRSKNSRQPLNRSARSASGRSSRRSRCASRGSTSRRSRSSVDVLLDRCRGASRGPTSGPPPRRSRRGRGPSPPAPSTRPPRRRTGSGPDASERISSIPSMYLKNSHSSRDFPVPASPTTATQPRSPVLGSRLDGVDDRLQLALTADERCLQPAPRVARHRTPADHPQRRPRMDRLLTALDLMRRPRPRRRSPPLTRGASRRRPAPSPARRSTAAGDAVLTVSPSTIPSASAPISTAAFPVSTPGPRPAAPASRPPRPAAVTIAGQRQRRPDRALGVVLAGDRRAPDRHHRVADELLDRPAVALDQRCGSGRSSRDSSSRTSSGSRCSLTAS